MPSSRLGLVLFAAWVVLLASTPLYAENYMVRIAVTTAMYSALALSWNVIGGFTGYPSFATVAFFGVGAYVGGIAQSHGVPMVAAWVLATVAVAAFAAALGAILLRLKGHYFAIGTIALVEVCRLAISSWPDVTGGGNGLNVPLLRWSPDEVTSFFLFVMIFLALCTFAMNFVLDRHRLGFGLRCIRQNEDAANMVGIDTTLYKVIAFTLSALFCGTVGAAYASWVGYIDPTDSFNIILTLKVPVMVMLGGTGTVLGPVLGATVFVLLEEFFWANFLNWNRAILGGVIVFLIFFLPGGLLHIPYRRVFSRLRRLVGVESPA
jgi:branched-chain amino acid transport system permease protein